MAQGSSQQPQQERRDQPQPPGGPFVVAQEPSGSQSAGPMDTGSGVVLRVILDPSHQVYQTWRTWCNTVTFSFSWRSLSAWLCRCPGGAW